LNIALQSAKMVEVGLATIGLTGVSAGAGAVLDRWLWLTHEILY
jgi:hypothetical protein